MEKKIAETLSYTRTHADALRKFNVDEFTERTKKKERKNKRTNRYVCI